MLELHPSLSCYTAESVETNCRGKSVLLDCGVHPGYTGLRSLPYLDAVALDAVDLMLITHFHLDHCAAVPYVTGHTNFKVCHRFRAAADYLSLP